MEGSLFVVERTEEPLHTIVVLNRISIENFCEPITTGLQVRVCVSCRVVCCICRACRVVRSPLRTATHRCE